MELPGRSTFSWLRPWWDSWSNPGECLHPQCSVWGCPNTGKQWAKQQTLCVRVVWNIRRAFCFSVRVNHKVLTQLIYIHIYLFCLWLKLNDAKVLRSDIPELVESVFICLKHVPHVEVQSMGRVPVLQLLKVRVLSESHVAQRWA